LITLRAQLQSALQQAARHNIVVLCPAGGALGTVFKFRNPDPPVLQIAAERLEQGVRQPPPDMANFTFSVRGLALGRNTTEDIAATAIAAGISALMIATTLAETQDDHSRRVYILNIFKYVVVFQDRKHVLLDWLYRFVGEVEDTEDEAAWFARVARYFTRKGVTPVHKDPKPAVGTKVFREKPFVGSFGEHTEPGRSVGEGNGE
jgi:hypothetical protein